MQVNDTHQAELENTIKMMENGIETLRGTDNLEIAAKTLSVIAAIAKHRAAKIRTAADEHNDKIMEILLQL